MCNTIHFSDENSLEYALLFWHIYLYDKQRHRFLKLLLNRNVSSIVMENDFKAIMERKYENNTIKRIGILLLEAGKVSLKRPDKYGYEYAYNINKMLDAIRKISNDGSIKF